MNRFKTREGEGEKIHPYNNMLDRQTFLNFILTKEKKFTGQADQEKDRYLEGNVVTTSWSLIGV